MLILLVIISIIFEFTSSGIVRGTDDALHIDLDSYRYGVLIHMIIANEYR